MIWELEYFIQRTGKKCQNTFSKEYDDYMSKFKYYITLYNSCYDYNTTYEDTITFMLEDSILVHNKITHELM